MIDRNSRLELAMEIIVLAAIVAFVFWYFKPDLLLLDTTTAGGDTGTHTYPAKYLHDYLIPNGKIIGWSPGWYAGFPLFQFYFPLPFVFMDAMTVFTSIEVAFKIVTVLGTLLLPICAYASMKLMGFKFPTPAIAAAFTLPFLFMEANSMWGGNVPSTLAGEFSFSFSLALTVLSMGLLYRGVKGIGEKKAGKKLMLHNAVLFAAVILSHVYTMLFALLTSLYLLISKSREEIISRFVYLFKTYGMAFMLAAFWLLPLVANLKYTTTYNYVWKINGWIEIIPEVLLPFHAVAVIAMIYAAWKKDDKVFYILFSLLVSLLLYFFAHDLGVVDIRFVPFLQLIPLLIAAYGTGELFRFVIAKASKVRWLGTVLKVAVPVAILALALYWTETHITFIDGWIKWNYEGFESKPKWETYRAVNDYLNGTADDPRVVYENSPLHDEFGTLRAFENLPLFAGRSTLEGLYMQSTPTSPFSFYIQSLVSQDISCPLPGYTCASINFTRAAPYLRMFNVKDIIVRTQTAIRSLNADSADYRRETTIDQIQIFELKGEHEYVEVLKYEPVLFQTKNWKMISYEWFKDEDALEVHLVFDQALESRVQQAASLNSLPRTGVQGDCSVASHVYNEEIVFDTDCVGKPHLVKMSYHPNWKVEGADAIYLVSPSFMLVYPTQSHVRMYYGMGTADVAGVVLTYAGIVLIVAGICLATFTRNQKLRTFLNL